MGDRFSRLKVVGKVVDTRKWFLNQFCPWAFQDARRSTVMDIGDMFSSLLLWIPFLSSLASGRTTDIVMTLEAFVQQNEELQVTRPRFPASGRTTSIS